MWPFDTEIDALNALYTWLEGIFSQLSAIPWLIAENVLAVAMAVIYPFVCIIDVFYTFVSNIYEIMSGFFNALISIPNTIFGSFDVLIVPYFPPFLIWVFVTLFTIRILQILWKHAKGISIAGFKVG